MAYNTGNPLGSKDPRDLYDNATNFDNYANGPQPFYPNRFGQQKLSIEGMNQSFEASQQGRSAAFQDFLNSSNYSYVGEYAAGLQIVSRSQYFVRSGVMYVPEAALTLPYTLTGDWATEQSRFKVLSDDATLRQDLAAPSGGERVGFSRQSQNELIDNFRAFASFQAVNVWEFANLAQGYVEGGDPTTWYWEDAINAANAKAVATGRSTYIPGMNGAYLVRPSKTAVGAGGARNYALDMNSNSRYIGDFGRTRVKIADGQSSNAAPKDFNMFMVTTSISNIGLIDIIWDMNGQNNLINGGRQGCATLNITGNSASANGIFITGCQFNNTPGTSQIVLGQSENGIAGPLSQNAVILRNKFMDNGLDTDDHSCVFSWCENVWATENTFSQSAALSRVGKNWVSFEVHGKNTWFRENIVDNFYRGCWIAPNFTSDTKNVHVSNNFFRVFGAGPSLFRELSSLAGLYDIFISFNEITMLATPELSLSLAKSCIELVQPYGIKNVYAFGNLIKSEDTAAAVYAFNLTCGLAGQSHSNIYFENNRVNGTKYGFYARVNNGEGRLDNLYELNNTYENLTTAGADLVFGSVYDQRGSSSIGHVKSRGNNHVSQNADQDWGVFLGGTLEAVDMDLNEFRGLGNYSFGNVSINNAATITRRQGAQICSGATVPTSGNWVNGDTFNNTAISIRKNIPHWKYNGSSWFAYGTGAGPTSERPTLAVGDTGYSYFDTTLSKFVLWSGSAWL